MVGQGVEQNHQEAMLWFRKAAEQGQAEAQFHTGWMYSHGLGTEQNEHQSVYWYRKAAQQGETRALEHLKALGIGTRDQVDPAAWERLKEFTLSWDTPEE